MNLPEIEKSLYDAISEFEIIDCHEHLRPEKARTDAEVDVFTLFSHYTEGDMIATGMTTEQSNRLYDQNISIDERWNLFEPFWEKIRYTSFSRVPLIAAKKFYGFDDINRNTYRPLSEAIKKANTPGIYDRVLRETCKIRTALSINGPFDTGTRLIIKDTPLLTPIVWIPMYYAYTKWEQIHHPGFDPDATVDTLDELLESAKQVIHRAKAAGAVGMKMVSSPYKEPSRQAAQEVFDDIKNNRYTGPTYYSDSNAFRDYVIDELIKLTAELDMVLSVHTGYFADFRKLDPLHMIPMLERHPEARFDIYHLGFPWVRETLMLGKGFSNVWLNLCWTHIISQQCAVSALREAIDLLPTNKLLAFGGDYVPVEKVYGHLAMAREDIAKALAERVADKQMTEAQALDIAHKWFWDNPVELYRLKV